VDLRFVILCLPAPHFPTPIRPTDVPAPTASPFLPPLVVRFLPTTPHSLVTSTRLESYSSLPSTLGSAPISCIAELILQLVAALCSRYGQYRLGRAEGMSPARSTQLPSLVLNLDSPGWRTWPSFGGKIRTRSRRPSDGSFKFSACPSSPV